MNSAWAKKYITEQTKKNIQTKYKHLHQLKTYHATGKKIQKQ
jgi:hypothetical protein